VFGRGRVGVHLRSSRELSRGPDARGKWRAHRRRHHHEAQHAALQRLRGSGRGGHRRL